MQFELGSERLLPRWVVAFFVGGALVLIPWIVLMFTVPQAVNVPRHWQLVWGGFDCFLVLGFAVTAFRLITRSPRGAVTAAMTGTMLLIDAWFDVLTTHRGGQIVSILMAVFAEIPCALICFYVSRRIVGLFEQAKDYLADAGFQVRGGQLVPPAGFPLSHHDAAAATPAASGTPVTPVTPARRARLVRRPAELQPQHCRAAWSRDHVDHAQRLNRAGQRDHTGQRARAGPRTPARHVARAPGTGPVCVL